MSVPRLFYCTVAGLVIATLLSFLFGASGLLNYQRLQAYQRLIAAGIATLEERHGDLERYLNLLRTEPELLRLLARETGYYRADELVIRVGPQLDPGAGGSSPYAPDFSDVGPLVVQPRLPAPRDPFNVLALGLFLGLGMFAALTVTTALRRRAGQAEETGGATNYAPAVAGSVEDAVPAAGGWTAAAPARAAAARAHDGPLAPAPAAPAAGGVFQPSAAADDVASGSERAAGSRPAADGAGAADPSPRRQRRRARRQRGDVTVYRL